MPFTLGVGVLLFQFVPQVFSDGGGGVLLEGRVLQHLLENVDVLQPAN